MAFTLVPAQVETDGTLATVAADAANGHKYVNDGTQRLIMFNPDGASITVTPNIPTAAEDDLADSNNIDPPAVTTTATRYYFRAYEPRLYNVRSGTDAGCMTFAVSGTVTNVLFAVV